jgi:hypothetical protein
LKCPIFNRSTPCADVAAFDAIIETVLTDNPFQCVDYEEAGVTLPDVARNRESYTVRVNYEDNDGRRVGTVTARAPTVSGFGTAAANILANSALAAALGGKAVRDSARETFSCQLRCCAGAG